MKKIKIYLTTAHEVGGLVRIAGEVSRNEYFDGYQQEPWEPPYDVDNFRVIASPLHNQNDITHLLTRSEIEKYQDALIKKYLDEQQAHRDLLIDEAIERSRDLARNAYA